jgi:hypothetical protein
MTWPGKTKFQLAGSLRVSVTVSDLGEKLEDITLDCEKRKTPPVRVRPKL